MASPFDMDPMIDEDKNGGSKNRKEEKGNVTSWLACRQRNIAQVWVGFDGEKEDEQIRVRVRVSFQYLCPALELWL